MEYGGVQTISEVYREHRTQLQAECSREEGVRRSVVFDSLTPWTVARQAPLSMGFSRQGYWSGLPSPPPGNLPDSKIELTSLMSHILAGGFFTTSTTWRIAPQMPGLSFLWSPHHSLLSPCLLSSAVSSAIPSHNCFTGVSLMPR